MQDLQMGDIKWYLFMKIFFIERFIKGKLTSFIHLEVLKTFQTHNFRIQLYYPLYPYLVERDKNCKLRKDYSKSNTITKLIILFCCNYILRTRDMFKKHVLAPLPWYICEENEWKLKNWDFFKSMTKLSKITQSYPKLNLTCI